MTTNDPKNRQARLTCTGKVLVPCKAMPRSVVFRNLTDATPPPQVVRITRGDGGPLALKVARVTHPGITTELVEVRSGEIYELRIGLRPPIRQARVRGAVVLDTGIVEKPQVNILVSATIPPSWTRADVGSGR